MSLNTLNIYSQRGFNRVRKHVAFQDPTWAKIDWCSMYLKILGSENFIGGSLGRETVRGHESNISVSSLPLSAKSSNKFDYSS